MTDKLKLEKAFGYFDAYNSRDPNAEVWNGKTYPKELLYAMRMTDHLESFAPGSAEHIKLAARSQHIGRWEIPRNSYPMDKKGYLQWRNTLKFHHAKIAGEFLVLAEYDEDTIQKVNALLLKKELNRNPETQLLEDVICLVFVEFYLGEFADRHDDDKVIDILRKTMKKMSAKAIDGVVNLSLSSKISSLIGKAAAPEQQLP
ncbi:MAG: DUF4202 domain-containing protein [Chryseolinea sp.]